MAGRKRKTLIVPETVNKPSGLKNDGTPNKSWLKFADRIKTYNCVAVEKWEPEEILGYLLDRYNKHYQIEFSLSYSGPPSKCSEIYCVKRIMTTVGSEKGTIIKQYIDWVFDTIIIPQKTKITSLAFFFTANLCNKFKSVYHKSNKITSSSQLPVEYTEAASKLNLSVSTYGDLAFVKLALDNSGGNDDYKEYSILFQELSNMGFDLNVLNGLA